MKNLEVVELPEAQMRRLREKYRTGRVVRLFERRVIHGTPVTLTEFRVQSKWRERDNQEYITRVRGGDLDAVLFSVIGEPSRTYDMGHTGEVW